ncbi:MAG TPA: ABC transporter permease, partial [Longimicrobiales bacterium]|nr:ABC transporter permease [Longimicrobiales bacterium]
MTWREWWRRVAASIGRGPSEADLQEELQFHRDMLEAQQRSAGAASADAKRQARLLLGGPSQIAEQWRDQRELPAVDMLRQDLTYGLRMLRRSPGFTAAAIVTLAVGIGANTSIFSVVNAVILRPLPYVDPDRLVTVGDREADGMSSNVDFTTASDLRSRSHALQSLALMRTWQPTLVTGGEAERIPAVRVSWDYFGMMGVRPALGRDFRPDDDRPDHWRVVIVSDSLWRRRFGADPAAVGRLITMNDREYRIVGVLPPGFEPLDAARYYVRAQMWAPIGYDMTTPDACRGCRHLRAFARLAPGVTVAQATADLNAIREQLRSEYPTKYERGSVAVVP